MLHVVAIGLLLLVYCHNIIFFEAAAASNFELVNKKTEECVKGRGSTSKNEILSLTLE